MSVLARFTSASLAGWVRIVFSSTIQILLVPVYLAYWDRETYGIWLTFQAMAGFTQIIDTSYQNFLGYEFLRVGNDKNKSIAYLFSSSLPVGIMIGLLDLIGLVGSLTFVQHWPAWLGHPAFLDSHHFHELAIALIAQSVAWLLFGTIGGIAVRVVAPFGYYPRMAWWGVVALICTAIIPALAVLCGAGIRGAGIAYAVSIVAYNIPQFCDFRNILRREKIYLVRPDILLGLRLLLRSQILTLKSLLEMLRQQGARLVLAPLVGASQLAAFATMRTGANTALQGLGTVTNPLMPELMRFLNQRDQARTEAAFSTVWIVLVAVMAPSVVLLQIAAVPLFKVWTYDKIAFDPILFALLSLGVLVYAAAQPAMAVVQGNNLLRTQLILSGLAGGVVVGGMILLVPRMGIRGAGCALLSGEIVAAIGYVKVATDWLNKSQLLWPRNAFIRVILSVLVASIAMMGIALLPQWEFLFLGIGLAGLLLAFRSYWKHLPVIARQKITTLIAKLPLGGRLAAALN